MLAWIVFISLFILPVAFLAGRFTARHAAAKGRSERVWFFWGALLFPLFPFPSVVVDLMPSRRGQMAVN
jgi:hypothetical protein